MVQAVYVHIQHRLFTGFADLVVHLAARFFHHFLNSRGMYAPVENELFQSDPRNFPAHRIKTGQYNGFRRIVYDEVDARRGFQRADVAAFAADDPALHFVIG